MSGEILMKTKADTRPDLPRALPESAARVLWRSIHEAVLITTLNSSEISLNHAAGLLMSRLVPDEPADHTALGLVNFLHTQGLLENTETERQRVGYQGRWFDLSFSPLPAHRLAIVLTDVSERVSLQSQCERLTQTNIELNDLFELSADGLVSVDRNGIITRMNQAYKNMLGIPDDRFVGQPANQVSEQGFLPKAVTPLVLNEKRKKSIVVSVRDKEILLTGRPVLDEQGEIVKIVTNIRDLTMLNKLSSELRKYHELANRYETELYHLRARQVESQLIGRSLATMKMMDLAAKASEVDSTVLIQGETGTGKELLVKTIHKLGKYQKGPLIAINCASIPETLIESELFGYEPGAFTGSSAKGKVGLFEAAHGGTLFLDEISEMPLSMQVKLLRAIQDKKIRRIGSNRDLSIDVRIIAASNNDLKELIKTNKFRSDLYYRLNIINIDVPPLAGARGRYSPADQSLP